MKIALIVPVSPIERTGNYRTAVQWKELLSELGHEVVVARTWPTEEGLEAELGVFLHGRKTRDSLLRFRAALPERGTVLALTGTDIYPETDDEVLDSIRQADRLVVLQEKAVLRVPNDHRGKVRIIFQSAIPASEPPSPPDGFFDVCVIGHLREVKDPLRAAQASRLLPTSSRIRVRQAGGIIDWKYVDLVEAEDRDNPRFEWLGELDGEEVARLLASSRLMVISSFSEGGARVVGESVINGTPILATRIDGITGLLGDDYPGYFDAGDTEGLAVLLSRAETDPEFLAGLKDYLGKTTDRFRRERELAAWKALIGEFEADVAKDRSKAKS